MSFKRSPVLSVPVSNDDCWIRFAVQPFPSFNKSTSIFDEQFGLVNLSSPIQYIPVGIVDPILPHERICKTKVYNPYPLPIKRSFKYRNQMNIRIPFFLIDHTFGRDPQSQK